MKFVKFIPFFIVLLFFSCTVEKTPFGNRLNFRARGIQEEATHINNNNHLISIEASDGEFLRGYNELSVKIVTANTFERLNVQRVELLVVLMRMVGSLLLLIVGYSVMKMIILFSRVLLSLTLQKTIPY